MLTAWKLFTVGVIFFLSVRTYYCTMLSAVIAIHFTSLQYYYYDQMFLLAFTQPVLYVDRSFHSWHWKCVSHV